MLSYLLQQLIDAVGERFAFVLILTFADAIPLFALNLFSHFVLAESDTNYFAKYRILKGQRSDPVLTKKCIIANLTSKFIGGPIVYALIWGPESSWNPVLLSPEHIPAWSTMALQILGLMIIEDTLMYWTHRLVHHPKLYAKVHKQHHEVHVSNGWAANWQSDADRWFTAVIPVFAGTLFFKSHITTRAIYVATLVFDSWVAHAGYDFPGMPFDTALRHNYHHSHNVGTYGLRFPFWDWLMGTDAAYKRWREKRQPTN